MITYIRKTPFPNCKYCGKKLNFYYPHLEDSEHECDECWVSKTSEKISDALIKVVQKCLNNKNNSNE